MARKSREESVQVPLDVIKMQGFLQQEFDKSSSLFRDVPRHPGTPMFGEDIMTDTRRLGTGMGRAFGAEPVTITEKVSACYQRSPAPANVRQLGLTHQFERMLVYHAGKLGIVGLAHLVDFGRTPEKPDADVNPVFDRALVFDKASGSMKYRESDGQNVSYVNLGSDVIGASGIFAETIVDGDEEHDLFTYPILYQDRIARRMIANEFQELRDTPVVLKGDRQRDVRAAKVGSFIGGLREVGRTLRNGSEAGYQQEM
jgi:hypothetical protein